MTITAVCPDAFVPYQRTLTVDGRFGVLVGYLDPPLIGFDVLPRDMVVIDAVGGEVWSGVWFTGRNGPRGWENWPAPNDGRWPLPGANLYSLIGVFSDAITGIPQRTFFAGNGVRCLPAPTSGRSFLRLGINDQWSLDNDGSFTARVTIWRPFR